MSVDPDRHYAVAQRRLGLDHRADRNAASKLANVLEEREPVDQDALRDRFEGETVVILGPSPGGAENVDPARPIVAAGSAVRQALSAGIQPTLVVTDLDGSDMGHKMFSRVGVPMFVHAHGDNTHLLDRLLPELEGPVSGTCQVPPPKGGAVELFRFGGFTDGDRACFVAAALGAKRLELVGWNLEEPVSGEDDKQAKLDVARALLKEVPVPIAFVDPDEPEGTALEDLVEREGESVSLDMDRGNQGTG